MRPGQNRRMRNRGRKAPNPLTKTFESNGPDVKVRGTAQHIAEKYTQLSRDAQASGDRVAAENYLQHAEHYIRIILSAQAQFQQNFGFPRQFDDDQDELGDEGIGYGVQDYSAPQPSARFPLGEDDMQPALPARGQQESRGHDRGQDARQEPRNGERFDRSDRQERPDRQERQERSDRQERPDRQERRERFGRRRDNGNRFAQPTAGEDADSQQPSLPAFLTTPVRTAPGTDEQPVIQPPRAYEVEAVEPAPAQPQPIVAAPAAPATDEAEPAEKAAPRTRKRRAVASAPEGEAINGEATVDETAAEAAGDAATPARKPRATRTRRKSVDDVSPVE